MKQVYMEQEKVGFWKRNKGKFYAIGAVAGGVIAIYAITNCNKKKLEALNPGDDNDCESKKTDYGRDCLITYSVQDTGEVLWKDLCTESYVGEVKDIGMDYENIRRLNGLE